ncbi:MAG: RNA polymerase sigma factor [Deltaproteobacteria bacterium]|nr:RNA polymerase sigma factor [Deltaproteobacteria bacterium]
MMATVTELGKHHDALLQRAGTGDLGAFDRLYREFAGYAYGIICRQTGQSPHAEDLLQQVFVKVFRELPEFRGDRPFRAWLRRACYFVVYDHWRRNDRLKTVPLEDDKLEQQMPTPSSEDQSEKGPEGNYIHAEIIRYARRLLDKLTPEKRMALIMHDFEGHTLEEAAEIIGVSKFTVRTRLVRARREFAKKAAKDKRLMQLIGRSES